MNWIIYPIAVLKDNYVWTIINSHHEAIIVDPGDATPVLHYLSTNHLQPKGILITHKHWDHTNGISGILNEFSIPVFGPKHDHVATVSEPVQEGDRIHIQHFPNFEVLDIPGHTLGHIAIFGEGILFCGDTLFSAGCGKIFEGTATQMHASLKKLSTLPAETKVYCGHEYTLNNLRFAKEVEPNNSTIDKYFEEISDTLKIKKSTLPSTIQIENKINPFLRCKEIEVMQNVEKYAGIKLATEVEIFANLREWKNNFV